jgi:hypothetical protein
VAVAAPYPPARQAVVVPVAVAAPYPAARQAVAVPAAAVAVFLASAARLFPRCAIRKCRAATGVLSETSCPVERRIALTEQKFRAVSSNSMASHPDLSGAQQLGTR